MSLPAGLTPARLGAVVAVVAITAVAAWAVWPHPDTLIVVQRGGVAVITDRFGRSAPLPDTVRVGGNAARRRIRVVNEDTITHRLAMLRIGAGERNDYTVPRGTFGGECSAHPGSKRLTFVIP